MSSYRVSRKESRFGQFFSKAWVRVAVVLICITWTLPTLGMLVSSFRSSNAIRSSGWWTVFIHPFEMSQWTIENYATVLTADGMTNAFINSLIITIPATIIPITIAAFAAYAFAWMKFPGREILFAIVVALLVVPLQMALIPVLRLYTDLDLNGTFLGTWLAHTGFGLPLAIFLLYSILLNYHERYSNLRGWMALHITPLLRVWFCPFLFLQLLPSPFSNFYGCGMICWLPWYFWARVLMWLS